MELNSWLIEKRGRSLALARHLGVPPSFVSKMSGGVKGVPIEHCYKIEKFTEGQVPRAELRPHDFWLIWPDLAAPSNPPAAQG